MIQLAGLVQTARNLASQPNEPGLVTDEQLINHIRSMYAQGIPATASSIPVRRGVRLPPRSLNVNGFNLTAAEKILTIEGPFADVTALYVDNTDATYDAIIRFTSLQAAQAIRVRAGKVRRAEFDTPTDSQGGVLAALEIGASATGTQTAPTYIEVE